MTGYLGKFPIECKKSKDEWALYFIGFYGGIDGDHHKAWVLDQVARILHGTEVIAEEAKWDNGESEIRVHTGKPTAEYLLWVKEMKNGEYGPDSYDYDEGIAP